MKRLFHISLAILLIIVVIRISAETVQTGTVKEYREKAQKTPLAGVELNVRSAQSTVSDKNGNFNLKFLTLKPGEKINVRNIEKMGYVIFNKDAVDQWNLNPNQPFTIVMCAASKFKQLKDQYYSNASRQYSAQYQKAQAELKRLKEQNKLKDSEYQARLKEIQDDYDRRLDNLDNYIDRFARIDMSELSEEEQKIIDLVREGDIEAAIQRYQKLNLLDKTLSEIEDINIIDAAIDTLSATREEKTGNLTQLLESLRRQIETIQLAGDYRNNDTIASIYTRVADAYPSNTYWLLETASFLKDICRYDDAMKYYEIALANETSSSNENSGILADLYNNLGNLQRALGNYNEALDLHNKSLALNIELLGEENIFTAQSYNNLGLVYLDMGNYAIAEDNLKRALLIAETLETEKPNKYKSYLADYNNNIMTLLIDLRRFDEAEVYGLYALLNRKLLYGKDHTAVGDSYVNLANIYGERKDHPKAIEYLQNALKIYLTRRGENHLNVASIYNNLGVEYDELGDYEAGLDAHHKALDIRKLCLDPNHPDIAASLNNIGVALNNQEKYQDALGVLKEALAIRTRVFESNHPLIASTMKNIALSHLGLQQYDEALDYCINALTIHLNRKEKDKYQIGKLHKTLGIIYREAGNKEEADKSDLIALNIFSEIDPNSYDTALMYEQIGFGLDQEGKYNEAIEQFSKARTIYLSLYGEESQDYKDMEDLIRALYQLDNSSE